MNEKPTATLGLIVGNRDFFPGHLVRSGREEMLRVLSEEGIRTIVLPSDETKDGGVGGLDEGLKCAQLFQAHGQEIDGILVTLPNFGDEKAIADAIRNSRLNVPVLVHAFNDIPAELSVKGRRDSYCGKLSVCNGLGQYGIRFTLTSLHTMDPSSEAFRDDLRRFVSTCRVVRGIRACRVGVLGTRPSAFNTVRYSEKLLEKSGISVEAVDLGEALAAVRGLSDREAVVKRKREEIGQYAQVDGIPEDALEKMARLGVFIDRWTESSKLDATAIQCWTALERNLGIAPCTLMSMLSDHLMPSACEADVAGTVSMYALKLASGTPSMLLDWNNNYGDDPDRVVAFHCGNLPRQVFGKKPRMGYSEIFETTVGRDNAYGTIRGRIMSGEFTYCRVSTDDLKGAIKAYVGEGQFTDDALDTFGTFGVAHVPKLQVLMKYVCENHFEHHFAATFGLVGRAVHEAFDTYLGWPTYHHP